MLLVSAGDPSVGRGGGHLLSFRCTSNGPFALARPRCQRRQSGFVCIVADEPLASSKLLGAAASVYGDVIERSRGYVVPAMVVPRIGGVAFGLVGLVQILIEVIRSPIQRPVGTECIPMIFGMAAIPGAVAGGPCSRSNARTLTLRFGAERRVPRPRQLRGGTSFRMDILPVDTAVCVVKLALHLPADVTAQFGQAVLDRGNFGIGRAAFAITDVAVTPIKAARGRVQMPGRVG